MHPGYIANDATTRPRWVKILQESNNAVRKLASFFSRLLPDREFVFQSWHVVDTVRVANLPTPRKRMNNDTTGPKQSAEVRKPSGPNFQYDDGAAL